MSDEPKQIKHVMVFGNGMVACFDGAGEQIPELQYGLFSEWAKRAEALGYEVEGLIIDAQNGFRWRLSKTESGFYIEPV